MKLGCFSALLFCTALLLSGCGARKLQEPVETTPSQTAAFTRESKIEDVKNAPIFGSYGRLLFPVEDAYYSGDTLEELQLTYYSHIDPDETVEIVNTLRERAADGQTIFYDIYTDEEKAADPAKEDTGLFFFKGVPGEKFAICNAGGAFAYVGAMQDSFPHALELSKRATTPSLSFIAPAHRPPARTWQEPSASSLTMRTNWKWTPIATPYGAARQEREWRRGLGLTVQKPLAAVICPAPVRSSCSTRD